MKMSLSEARNYFYNLHDVEVNQKYGGELELPYSFHLKMVERQAIYFNKYIPSDDPYYSAVWVGIYGHDAIEDARLSYNDIKSRFGELSADIIYLCTEHKGKTRSERKPVSFYTELIKNDLAVFVKICDIIANTKFSLLTNSSMFNKYREEYDLKVSKYLYTDEYKDMFRYLDELYSINK
jgi:hypothetical protein